MVKGGVLVVQGECLMVQGNIQSVRTDKHAAEHHDQSPCQAMILCQLVHVRLLKEGGDGTVPMTRNGHPHGNGTCGSGP